MIGTFKELITSIKYGPHLKSDVAGDVKYLKGNHFDEDGNLRTDIESYTYKSEIDNKHLLQEGDVILAAKGFRNFAWRCSADSGDCIASSLFYVIRVDTRRINSEYFTLCINSPRIQSRLKAVGLGATIPSIPKKELLNITIDLPSMEKQMKAVALSNLIAQQINIERRILEKRIGLKNGIIDLIT